MPRTRPFLPRTVPHPAVHRPHQRTVSDQRWPETAGVASIRLLRFADIGTMGVSSRQLKAAVVSGALVRARPGVYARGTEWKSATPEGRVIARAVALALTSSTPPVYSHETAAALHGLPLYRPDPQCVHAIVPPGRPGAARGVIRHRGELTDDDVVEIDGVRVTSLARTVADVARTTTFEQSVTVADAAMRKQFVRGPGEYDPAGADGFRAATWEIVRRSAHGQTRARRALAFADGRAQLPGESISRIRLFELGFRQLELQVPVTGPNERTFYVDFGFERESAFGEFDGAIKYVDGNLFDGRTSSAILDDEKQREDWIRGTTDRRYARWGWPHLRTATELGERLMAFGIRPLR